MSQAHQTIDRIGRECYGRLLAILAAKSHDLAAAEDALSDAFSEALIRWPTAGTPDNPEAWLLTTARRKRLDSVRRASVQQRALEQVGMAIASNQSRKNHSATESESHSAIFLKDERLKLMFVCAHPAVDPATRTPLMLQTLLGLDAARIASSMLIAPTTMGQRLSRAKRKIRDAGISFELPRMNDIESRVANVLETIYAAFGLGWDDAACVFQDKTDLTIEAIWLARTTCELLPNHPETLGLLALMLFCDSRSSARRTQSGNYVPFDEQLMSKWEQRKIDEAEFLLDKAFKLGNVGPFQLEAAIQSAHICRRLYARNTWNDILYLYQGLIAQNRTVGAMIGYASAVAETSGPLAALRQLDSIDTEHVSTHLPYWSLRADLHRKIGRFKEAATDYRRAIGLAIDPAVRRFLQERANQLPIE